MTRSAKTWKWPTPEDKLFCNKKDVLRIITPPTVAGNRGQFSRHLEVVFCTYFTLTMLKITIFDFAML